MPLAGWTQPISCFQVPPGLVAWWPLDDATNQTVVLDNFSTHHGTPRDSNNNTIPVGIPTLWQLPDPAVFNGTLLPVVVDPATSPPRGAFFYSDTYVEVPHHANLNIGTNGLTIVLWVWPSLGSGDPQPLVEKYDLTTTDGYSVYLDPLGPTSFVVRMNLNGTVVTGPTISTSMTPSDWWFVVARVTPGGAVTLGACDMAGNCTNISAVTVPNFLTANTAPLWLGRSVVASPTGMDLRAIRLGMDEVELFGRALSQAEVQTIYAAEVTGLRKCTPAPGSGQLCVRKFHDLDADGTPDPNEPSLPGWQFVVTDAASNVVGVVTSTLSGTVPGCLTLPPGTYVITETLLPGWTNTTPLSQTVSLQPGQTTNLVFGNVGCLVPPVGLVAWYPLDEPAGATAVQDIAPAPFSTVNDTGTTQPGPIGGSGPTPVPGKVGSGALYFFGPHIQVPHSPDLAFAGDFSIDAWIRVVDCGHGQPPGGVWAPIVDKWDPATQTGIAFFVDQPAPATGVLKLQWNNLVFTSTGTLPASANPPANVGPWVHVAVTVDATSGQGVFYINGTAAGTFTVPAGSAANTLPMLIGETRLPGGRCEIAIDELELFDRVLSSQEVLALYASDSAGKCRPTPKPDAQICVDKFLDLNANGTWDPNEPPLSGWQFVVTDAASNVVGVVTSTPPGTVPGCLTLPAGSYTVTETLQPGWTNTTPLSQTVTLQPGQTTNLVFGNMGCFQPPPGLVAWWPLDDAINQTVVQEWIGGLNGTPRNSANVTIPVGIPTLWQLPDPGVFGGTLLPVVVDPSTTPPRGAFFYSDTFVEVPHHANLNIGTNGATIVLWVWPTLGTGGPQPLVEKFDAASTNGYAVWLDNLGSGTFGLRLNLNGTLVTGPSFSVSMQPSDWRFIVVRVAPGGAVVLGACDMVGNCTNSAAVTVANYLTTNTAPFWLARSDVASPAGTVRAIRVGMDEVEMFNRALSQSELQTIYTSELAGLRKCAPPTGVAELCIAKFHDYDGDGIQDPNEPGLAGWSFLLNPAPPGLGTNVVTTGPGGLVCIPVLAPFTYSIAEMIQSGWTNTTPGTQTITTAPGQATNVVFGNMQTPTGMAELCIFKFHDYDGDGVQDPNEPGLAGWQFVVNPAPLSTGTNVVTTLAGGAICMGVSAPGVYTITEIAQSGWTNTTATNLTIAVSPGQLTNLYFGNALTSGPARICVLKYHDWNLNGVHDPGEPVLPGWTILIKDPLGNTNQVVITSTNFVCVTVPAPAVYHVSEVLPPPIGPWVPWTPTSPASGTYSNVTVAPGQTVNLLFGNRKNIKWWPPVVNPSPLRLILRASVEPGESYQLEYRESLDPDAPWIPVGEPVLASEPEVVFEVAIPAAQRQGYYRVKEMLKGNPD
ncbi:LamG-like jellyroll fold domain-containing protein [Limisphaera sp. VF-2]|uniref:LamG-like jellyroll fold domain-containing protein n=1 Tax=Limisphaera sp. VF-2 TaxID=3400418 RepID=UPI003C2F1958